jgi:hypothetical protein
MTNRSGRCEEQGIALIFAIVMIVLIVGFLAVFTLSSTTARDERTTERGRMQSEVWASAAAAALAGRLERGELGYQMTSTVAGGRQGRILQPFLAGAVQSHGTGSCGPSFPITTADGGSGFYCVLPPVTGLPPGTGFLNLHAADPERGTVRFVVRTWGTQGAIRPLDVELKFGRESLSRYAVLSDAPIWLDKRVGTGSLVLPAGARLHSNNSSNAQYGIYMRGSVVHTNAARITTTRARSGRAVDNAAGAPACPNGNKCYISGKTVSFNSTYQAFNRVARADPAATCPLNNVARYASGFRMCRIPASLIFPATVNGTMPMFRVNVGTSCVTYSYARYPLRTDSLSYPVVNDSVAPTLYGTGTSLCATNGGGTLLFEGDVIVTGRRPAGSPPITIMARRPQNINTQRVTIAGPGGTWVTAQVAEAASIYVMPATFGGNGTGNTASPLGIVAEGGVFVPTHAATGNFTVTKASLIAAGSSFSLGPSFQQIAGDTSLTSGEETGNEVAAGGLNPCVATATEMPTGGTLSFSGTFASRGLPFLSYVNGTCARGYADRTYQFDMELGWNPPPFFPAPAPWHLVDSRVLST